MNREEVRKLTQDLLDALQKEQNNAKIVYDAQLAEVGKLSLAVNLTDSEKKQLKSSKRRAIYWEGKMTGVEGARSVIVKEMTKVMDSLTGGDAKK